MTRVNTLVSLNQRRLVMGSLSASICTVKIALRHKTIADAMHRFNKAAMTTASTSFWRRFLTWTSIVRS